MRHWIHSRAVRTRSLKYKVNIINNLCKKEKFMAVVEWYVTRIFLLRRVMQIGDVQNIINFIHFLFHSIFGHREYVNSCSIYLTQFLFYPCNKFACLLYMIHRENFEIIVQINVYS